MRAFKDKKHFARLQVEGDVRTGTRISALGRLHYEARGAQQERLRRRSGGSAPVSAEIRGNDMLSGPAYFSLLYKVCSQ